MKESPEGKKSWGERVKDTLERHTVFETFEVVGEARVVGEVAIVPISRAHLAVAASGKNLQLAGGALGAEPLVLVSVRKDGRTELHEIPRAPLPEDEEAETPPPADPAALWRELEKKIPGLEKLLAQRLEAAGWPARPTPPKKLTQPR